MSTELYQSNRTVTGHSAAVEMWLHFGCKRIPVLQSGGTEIKVRDPDAVPLGDAVVEIIVDGRSHRHAVRVLAERPRPNWIAIEDSPADS